MTQAEKAFSKHQSNSTALETTNSLTSTEEKGNNEIKANSIHCASLNNPCFSEDQYIREEGSVLLL